MMVEGSPRRVSVSQEVKIKTSLDLTDDEEHSFQKHHHESVRKTESEPGSRPYSPGGSRWKKLRTTVQLGNAVAHHRRPPLKREDSFLKRFSTRPPNLGPEEPARPGAPGARRWLARVTVLNPDESPLFGWLWVVTLCGLYNSWTLIARQAFPELQEAHKLLWQVLDWCSDLVYLLDIAVQFRTGYLEQGIMVRDGVQLAKHYVASRDFFLDVAALVPLGFMHNFFGESPLLRFPRFLKARRIYKFYYAVESRTAYPNLWRVANLIHVLLLLAHWFGCFYYMLSELEGFQGQWAYKHPENERSPLVRKYLGSVYWSTLTLTTIGDLATPATNLQYLFTIISYLIGVFIFATIVGQVGNVITNRNASRLEFERLLDGAKLYMRHHKVPKGMQRRVQRWYDYSWSRGRMQGGGDIHSALGILPDKLKTELAIHVNLKTLKKVSIFQECQPEFLHDLVLKMKAYIFTPGDLVCRKGEVAREMFIIADGILQVINEKGQVLTQMRAGDFFGEIGILNLDGFNRRTADVRSVGYSELFSLSREDVLSAMKDYPEAEAILQSMGRRRLMEARMTNSTDKSQISENLERADSRKGNGESRQRKKGISLAYLLKSKREPDHDQQLPSRGSNFSFGSDSSAKKILSPNLEPKLCSNSLIKANYVHLSVSSSESKKTSEASSSSVSTLVDRILHSKLRKRNKLPHFSLKRKKTFWCKISKLVHRRQKKNVLPAQNSSEVENSEDSAKSKSCDVVLKPENLALQLPKRSLPEAQTPKQSESRRTSWQPSKPSVSNWNRSELFTSSIEKMAKQPSNRRKTLCDGMLLSSSFAQEKLSNVHQKVPGILMTGSGLNARSASPDISPMSSNYSLTPSTSEDEEVYHEESSKPNKTSHVQNNPQEQTFDQVPMLSPFSGSIKDFVGKIVEDFKSTMDTYIVESQKDMCLRILDLEEEIRQKDATIKGLQQQCAKKFGKNFLAEEDTAISKIEEIPKPISSIVEKPRESVSYSIDITSPTDPANDVQFEEEDLWLVEFPQNAPIPLEGRRQKLRRHSSVEVGHELPFRLAAQKPPNLFLTPTGPSDGLKSPRRFSESQARPDVVPLNTSFAARVRRVFAKVKANRALEEQTSAESSSPPITFKWPILSSNKTEAKASTRRSSTGNLDKQVRLQSLLQQRTTTPSARFQNVQNPPIEVTTRHGSDGKPVMKRFLPTITESCSFDSLRESPLLVQTTPPPVVSMPNLDDKKAYKDSVVIDMTMERSLFS